MNSYHIHLNTLKFHGYGKEISQKYPCSLYPINTSFLSTLSSPCHPPSPDSSSGGGLDEELTNPYNKNSPKNLQVFDFFDFEKKWPSTSSCLRLIRPTLLLPFFTFLQVYLLSFFFFFSSSLSFLPSNLRN